jgi:hypothetical protein
MLSLYKTPEQKMHMESYTAKDGNWLPIFQHNPSVHLQTERSVTTNQPIQHNTPEERRPRLYLGGSPKSYKDAHFSKAIMEKESFLRR